ncbi:hypothetical protein BGZ58_004038 [Dissophora ornata]|nr:hypothetical protein BGZ58_004038 [Dissophora ornata]
MLLSSLEAQNPVNSKIEADDPHPNALSSSTTSNFVRSVAQRQPKISKRSASSLFKRAPAPPVAPTIPKYRAPKKKPTSGSSVTSKKPATIPDTPLLLLPDSRSIWQTGSYQTVKWSRKYSKSLPKDTTVDIILVDSNTNEKVFSLKRFILFRKGSAQVWVPVNIPEGLSFVLVLELYHGRSQKQVTGTVASSLSPPGQKDSLEKVSDAADEIDGRLASSPPPSSKDELSTVVRRSDISIASRSRKIARDSTYPESTGNTNSGKAVGAASNAASRHDINNDDYYVGASEERPFGFLPGETREEYPNTVQPLVLEHTFGLHQKVYAMTPYTLEWKIPDRIAELLDYTRQVQMAASLWSKNNQGQQSDQVASALTPKSTFLAKVMVELVMDETMESVAVLARDIPAETMFQYLSIQDRVPQSFYRLRVQMVVVQVKMDAKTLAQEMAGGISNAMPGKQMKGMEGWEFPSGGKVIDRYESITRRFWVTQGAL